MGRYDSQKSTTYEIGNEVRATYHDPDGNAKGKRKATITAINSGMVTVKFKDGEEQTKHFSWVISDY